MKPEEYNAFYKEKFGDWQDPLAVIHTSAEGAVTYKAMLYIPAHTPYDFYTREYEKGLQLYSSGVLIMDKCADLLPDHFRFVKGVVDSQDFSLNISREMLQHTRQLKVIATALEKKIKAELMKLQKEDREKYETVLERLRHPDQVRRGGRVRQPQGAAPGSAAVLVLQGGQATPPWPSIRTGCPRISPITTTPAARALDKIAKLPQVERILDKGYEILYCTEDVDDFVMQGPGRDGRQEVQVGERRGRPAPDR